MVDPDAALPHHKRKLQDAIPHPDAAEARQILRLLRPMVEPLQRSIPGNAEVVLHDLTRLPNSIVAIAGDVTHRSVGSPATDSLLRLAASGRIETTESYDIRIAGGRELRSTNLVFRDSHGTPAYALSINIDVTLWRAVHVLAASLLPEAPTCARAETVDEQVASEVDTLASKLLGQALSGAGVPVDLMHKRHKLAVVEELRDRGFFLIRDAVEMAASGLGVTRYTIYNYLNELESAATPG